MIPNQDNRFEILIHSGAKDKNGVDIGKYDIVKYGSNKYVVRYNLNKLSWVISPLDVKDSTQWEEPLNLEMASNMEVVSNLLEEASHEGEQN